MYPSPLTRRPSGMSSALTITFAVTWPMPGNERANSSTLSFAAMGASMATSGVMFPALQAALNAARSRRVWTAFAIATLRCSGVRVGGSLLSPMSYILSTYP